MSISCTVFEIAKYWSKIADFNLPQLYLAFLLVVTPFEFRRCFRRQKTRIFGLYRTALLACSYVFSRLGRTPTCDEHTDRLTETWWQHIPR